MGQRTYHSVSPLAYKSLREYIQSMLVLNPGATRDDLDDVWRVANEGRGLVEEYRHAWTDPEAQMIHEAWKAGA